MGPITEVQSHTLTFPDGRTLFWREAGRGRPLIMLHGWAMSSAVFSEAMASFSDSFRVLVPDLRGHGNSTAAAGYALDDFADDLAFWVESLKLESVALLGWSLGGQVAIALYPRLRPCIDRLLFINSTPRFSTSADWAAGLPDGQIRAMVRDLRKNYLLTMNNFFTLQFAGENIAPERHRQIVGFAVRAGRLPDPDVALSALETLRCADQREQLSVIDVPVLVMHGELDRIVPPAAGRYLSAHLARVESSFFPDLGHAPFLSRPDAIFSVWRTFLS